MMIKMTEKGIKICVIGHPGLTATHISKINDDYDTTSTSSVITPTISLSSSERNYQVEFNITKTGDLIDYTVIEDRQVYREAIERIKSGWLKPHKKLVSNHLKINFNLHRSRAREKKQIFILNAAA